MNITSKDTMIFCKEDSYGKIHYKAGLSTKKQDGTYDNAYIDVRMPKDTKLENKTKININKGFLSFFKTKDDKVIWYVVVQEFTTNEQLKKTEVYEVENYGEEQLDLPF